LASAPRGGGFSSCHDRAAPLNGSGCGSRHRISDRSLAAATAISARRGAACAGIPAYFNAPSGEPKPGLQTSRNSARTGGVSNTSRSTPLNANRLGALRRTTLSWCRAELSCDRDRKFQYSLRSNSDGRTPVRGRSCGACSFMTLICLPSWPRRRGSAARSYLTRPRRKHEFWAEK
jgi:hypothetical protein